MANPPAAFTVWADNPDTGKRLGFGFSSIAEAHAKVAQLKMAKFRAVEMIGRRPHVPEGAYEPERVQAMLLEENGYRLERVYALVPE